MSRSPNDSHRLSKNIIIYLEVQEIFGAKNVSVFLTQRQIKPLSRTCCEKWVQMGLTHT